MRDIVFQGVNSFGSDIRVLLQIELGQNSWERWITIQYRINHGNLISLFRTEPESLFVEASPLFSMLSFRD